MSKCPYSDRIGKNKDRIKFQTLPLFTQCIRFVAHNYTFKVNNKNIITRYEIRSNGIVLLSLLVTLIIFHALL